MAVITKNQISLIGYFCFN